METRQNVGMETVKGKIIKVCYTLHPLVTSKVKVGPDTPALLRIASGLKWFLKIKLLAGNH